MRSRHSVLPGRILARRLAEDDADRRLEDLAGEARAREDGSVDALEAIGLLVILIPAGTTHTVRNLGKPGSRWLCGHRR